MLTIFGKSFILDVWHDSEYVSEWDLKQEKKATTIFQAGNYAQHTLIFFTDFRLDMLISAMLIKKTCMTPYMLTFQSSQLIHAEF